MMQHAIAEAARDGDLSQIEALLREGASPNGASEDAKAFAKKENSLYREYVCIPPLHLAASMG